MLDQLAEPTHHWSWYQLNGRSAQENYKEQRADIDRWFFIQELKRKLIDEEKSIETYIPDVKLTIKS